MKKTMILVSFLAVALVGTLYSLPKTVVNTKDLDRSVASAQKTDEHDGEDHDEAEHEGEAGAHAPTALTADQKAKIDPMRSAYQKAAPGEQATAAVSLSDAFGQYQMFDSAAFYAERAAILTPNLENHLRAGDRYYSAYGFATEEKKATRLGDKTRTYYQKALDQNPELLTAKANMAMTYVNTPTPMSGIMMLREVLDADPTNELALFNLGILSMRSNQYTKAVDRFQQILQGHPNNTKAQFYLGVCLVELGRNDEAKKVLADVKKKETDPVIQQAIGELEQRINQL